jgi:hypothetical protein
MKMGEKTKLRLMIFWKYLECGMSLNKLATGLNDEKFFNEYLQNRKDLNYLEKQLKKVKMEEKNHEEN